jgi:multicomponent Na+:H+ antiporter subunit D
MNAGVLALPVAAPLLAAGVLLAVRDRQRWRRAVALGTHGGIAVLGAFLLLRTMDGAVLSLAVGAWPGGISIVLAADALSALLVLVTAVLVGLCLLFAFATGDDTHRLFSPLVMALTAGAYGAYLTADLFNLFVFIEVMLAPSYVLLVLTGGRKRVAAARVYLSVSLLASTVLLIGIGLVYGLTGTVNLGALAGAASRSPAVALAGAVPLVALAIKAGVVPLHGWLPRVYPHATPAVVALFSGLLTKVGVYAMFRVYAVMYDGESVYQWVFLVVAVASMLVGSIGSVGENTFRAILVFGMVSHIGYMMVGPALFTDLALAAAIFYLVHHVLVKAALLMCAGAVEITYGTGRLDRLDGLVNRSPLLAVIFMIGAMSLAGVPPLSGFVAKLTIIRAAITEEQWLVGAVAAAVGVVTIVAMVKIWNNAFWGQDSTGGGWDDTGQVVTLKRVRTSLLAPALVLVAFSIGFGIGAQPLLTVAEAAAAGLLDTSGYVAAVVSP